MRKLTTLLLTLPLMAMAADPIDDIITEIQTNNPLARALRAEQTAELLNRSADNRLEATELGFDYKWSSPAEEGTKMAIELSQGFDWPGVYAARRKAARSAEAAMTHRRAEQLNSIALEARTQLLTVIDANRRCDMLRMIVANLDTMHVSMHSLLEQREATELDHRKVALEEIAMKQQLAEAENSRTDALAAIAALNGGTLPAGVADLREYPQDELLPLASYINRGNPEADAELAEAATGRLDARAARMDMLPGFSLGYVFEREAGVNFQGFSIGVRLPQYSAKTRAKAISVQALAAEHRAEQAEQSRRAEISAAHRDAQTTARLLSDYETALGKDYTRLLRRSLDAGQISYAEYFTELNFYLAAQLEFYSQQLRYHTLLATLLLR